jgi:hypothetical protein
MKCPNCRRPLHIQRRGISPAVTLLLVSAFNIRFHCPFCEARIALSSNYLRWTLLLVVLLTTLVASVFRTPSSGGAWLLGMMFIALLLRAGMLGVFPPPLSLAPKGDGIPFAACYLGLALIIFVEQFIFFGWGIVAMGSRQDLYDHFQMLSVPLAWINPNFLITPEKSFLDVCGIILANSYFGAFFLWLCGNGVRAVFRRNRVTRMSITDVPPDSDD